MQSTRSFFNRAIFGKTVKRYWPMWALYLLIWTLAMCICAQSSMRFYDHNFYSDDMLEFCWQFGLFASLAACCLSAMLVHSWMYNARSAGAYAALPVSRSSMFLSVTLSGIVPLIACNLIASLAAFFVGLFNGHFILLTVLQCFLSVSLECIFFYGLATLCATLTGHVFVLPAVYIIFNFVVTVVELLVKELMSLFTFGATLGSTKLDFLSPLIYMLDNVYVDNGDGLAVTAYFRSWWPFIIYALVGIVLAVIGLLIFRRRKMESASDVVAVRLLKPVFKYCLCLGSALVLGIFLFILIFDAFFTTGNPVASVVICLCMLVGGFIGYFAAEMLMKKSFKVFRKAWKGYLVAGAVIILFITAMEADLFGYERRIPDLEDVQSVNVRIWGEGTAFNDASDIADIMLLHERIINNKSQTEKNLHRYYSDTRYRASSTNYPYQLYISYMLDNGSTLERRYELIYNESDKFCTDLLTTLNQSHAIKSRIESAINTKYIENAYITYYYHVPTGTYTEGYDEHYSISIPTNSGSMEVTAYEEHEYVNGSLQLTAQQARALYDNAIKKDIMNGDIGRVTYNDELYMELIDVDIEFTARVPYGDNKDDWYHQYVYLDDVTDDAKYTVAALKELGIDLEALASSAIE